MLNVNNMRRGETINSVLGLRLRGEELERYNEILRRAFQRQPRANNTDVNRRLLELDPDTDGLVTAEDIAYFRGQPNIAFGTSETSGRGSQAGKTMIVPKRIGGDKKSQPNKQVPKKRQVR